MDTESNTLVMAGSSRSNGETGIAWARDGVLAAVRIDTTRGVDLDLVELGAVVATDITRPASLELFLDSRSPCSSRATSVRDVSLHALLRWKPAWIHDVLARRGGGARGAAAMGTATIDRLLSHLARSAVPARPLSAAALRSLLSDPFLGSRCSTGASRCTAFAERIRTVSLVTVDCRGGRVLATRAVTVEDAANCGARESDLRCVVRSLAPRAVARDLAAALIMPRDRDR